MKKLQKSTRWSSTSNRLFVRLSQKSDFLWKMLSVNLTPLAMTVKMSPMSCGPGNK